MHITIIRDNRMEPEQLLLLAIIHRARLDVERKNQYAQSAREFLRWCEEELVPLLKGEY